MALLSEIDVQATLKEKIGADIERYTILGVCNPDYAHSAIEKEPNIGLLLPCNVLLREEGGKTLVFAQDPHLMMRMVGNPGMSSIAEDAAAKIRHALSELE